MEDEVVYDIAIVGGGFAGLALAILMAKKNKSVLLLEKNKYPYHKVCGEYISNESRMFLTQLGVQLNEAVNIQTLVLSSHDGLLVKTNLGLGGFGISRFNVDYQLAQLAKQAGVILLEATTFRQYKKEGDVFIIQTNQHHYKANLLCGSFGKYSCGNFYSSKPNKTNWIGIKYHVEANFDEGQIALHTFTGGYCGISKVEGNKYCLCYIVEAQQLNKYGKSIELLEQNLLSSNPMLAEVFNSSKKLWQKPEVISNITFSVKKPVHDDVYYLGDSAGSIAPLTGNGMSNALRSAYLFHKPALDFLNKKITQTELTNQYSASWEKAFKQRIWVGNIIHYIFCKTSLTNILVLCVRKNAWLRKQIIKQTHGKIIILPEEKL